MVDKVHSPFRGVLVFLSRILAPGWDLVGSENMGALAMTAVANVAGLCLAVLAIVSGTVFALSATLVWLLYQLPVERWLARPGNGSGAMASTLSRQAQLAALQEAETGSPSGTFPNCARPSRSRLHRTLAFVVCFAPLAASVAVLCSLTGIVCIQSETVTPGLTSGDGVMYLKRADGFQYGRGELVVVDWGGGVLDVGRIVALPGEALWKERVGLCVPDGCFPARSLALSQPTSDSARYAVEVVGNSFHLISLAEPGSQGADGGSPVSPSIRLAEGEYGVLSDSRTSNFAGRCTREGAVASERLLGRPLYVLVSSDLSEIGLKVR